MRHELWTPSAGGWRRPAGPSVEEVDFVDVAAVRGDERLYAEAKGRTAAIGTDLDTLYGQLPTMRALGTPSSSRRSPFQLRYAYRRGCGPAFASRSTR